MEKSWICTSLEAGWDANTPAGGGEGGVILSNLSYKSPIGYTYSTCASYKSPIGYTYSTCASYKSPIGYTYSTCVRMYSVHVCVCTHCTYSTCAYVHTVCENVHTLL